jgi:hypothetical protein
MAASAQTSLSPTSCTHDEDCNLEDVITDDGVVDQAQRLSEDLCCGLEGECMVVWVCR